MNTIQLNPTYLRSMEEFENGNQELEINFKNGQSVKTSSNSCKAVLKENGPILATSSNGARVSVHLAFAPTNDAQRVFLSVKCGTKVEKGELFTFATRERAKQVHLEMVAVGIKSTDINWPVVVKKHTASETAQRQLF